MQKKRNTENKEMENGMNVEKGQSERRKIVL